MHQRFHFHSKIHYYNLGDVTFIGEFILQMFNSHKNESAEAICCGSIKGSVAGNSNFVSQLVSWQP